MFSRFGNLVSSWFQGQPDRELNNSNSQDKTMFSKSHLQPFNPYRSAHHGEVDFQLFPKLPTELRLKTWRHALERQRLIHVELSGSPEQWAEISNGIDSRRGIGQYCVYINGYQLMSKYLRVSRESRRVALEFYHVHIPCQLTSRPGDFEQFYNEETKSGTLYFNPYYDILHIRIQILPPNLPTDRNDYLLDFLQDLKNTYDPLRVGLLNLAVESNDLSQYEWSGFDCRGKSAFLETINQLHEVVFMFRNRFGRTNFGAVSGVDTNEVFFNRSLPVMPLTPSFDRLSSDPRSITRDLERVHLNSQDLRQAPAFWQRLLRQWGVSQTKTKYTYLLAFVPAGLGDQVFDRKSAIKWLKTEEVHWNSSQMRKYICEMPEEELAHSVNPAFGFWLFPIDAVGPYNERGELENLGRLPSIRDLSARWPELALSSLP